MKVDNTNVQQTTEVLPFAKPMLGDVFSNPYLKLHYGDLTDGASLYKILNISENASQNEIKQA
jgi:DnaJ-class molecular chaperone